MSPLISVIVPIYQVEEYLETCIISIINQTYKNLEIILVNDGSKDGCASICEKFAKLDQRIIFIKKENGGLSDARNAGIKIAKGDFLTFVDSDDCIHPEMIEVLFELISKNSACLSVVHFQSIKGKIVLEDQIKKTGDFKIEEIQVLDKVDAMSKMLYQEKTDSCAWGKLYKKDLFENIEFPKGKIYEDIGIMYYILDLCKTVVFSSFQGYFYLLRDNSISLENFHKKKMVLIDFVEENHKLLTKYPQLELASANRIVRACFHMYLQIPKAKEWEPERNRIKKIVKIYRKKVLFDKKSVKGTKVALLCSYVSFDFLLQIRNLKKWGKTF